jgi:Protein of unknown function (DUF1566)
MKKLYSVLIALGVLALFASVASAAAAKPAFPSWSQQINTTKRFTVLAAFGGAAVLDTETGLVWEQSPSTGIFIWSIARIHCNQLTTGGRFGWRLPTIQELASLMDPNNPGGNPDLPPGHPFSNVQSSVYWSATTVADNTSVAWDVSFGSGNVSGDLKGVSLFVWCVRGGQGVDPQ